jgi:hypothetical protein
VGWQRRVRAGLGLSNWIEEYHGPAAGRRHATLAFGDLHHDVCSVLDDYDATRVGIGGFRGMAKTAIAGLGFPIREAITNPEMRYLRFAGATEDLAAENIATIRTEIEKNRALAEDFGDLKFKRHWGERSIRILKPGQERKLLHQRDTCLMRITAPRGNIRGTKGEEGDRLQLVIVDDPQPRKRVTARQREEFESWFWDDLEPAVAEDGGRILVLTNLSHLKNILSKILDGCPLDDGRGGTYGKADERRAYVHEEWTRRRYAVMVPDPEGTPDPVDPSKRWRSAWPARLPIERLFEKRERLRRKGRLRTWLAEWMSTPTDDAGRIFQPEATDMRMSYAMRPPFEYVEAWERWPKLRTVGTMDPAFSLGEKAHETALVVGGHTGEEEYFPLLDYFHRPGLNLAERRDLVWKKNAQWRFHCFGFEVVRDADLWESFIEDQRRKIQAGWENASFQVLKLKPPRDKAKPDRIGDLAWAQVQGIWRLAGTHGEVRLLQEDYRGAEDELDDLLDAMQMCWRLCEALQGGAVVAGLEEPQKGSPRRREDDARQELDRRERELTDELRREGVIIP